MPKLRVRYSIDTSAFIDGLERYYPAAVFEGLWEAVEGLIGKGRLFASEEVWQEIKKKDEAAKVWMEPRRAGLFIPTDSAITAKVSEMLGTFPRMVMSGGHRNRADPFVVALAQVKGATVVTGEGNDGSENRPKIPYVCRQLGIPCLRFTELIAAEHWTFGLANATQPVGQLTLQAL